MTVRQLIEADEAGIRLEMVQGVPIWEAHPKLAHVRASRRIEATIRKSAGSGSDCGCIHYADLYIRFPDGSFKRPDIAIFFQEPEEDAEEAVVLVPEAVIEILSRGYEKKDLEIGPPFYLAMGVKDVVVVDPHSSAVVRFTKSGREELMGPTTLWLECGCEVTV